MRRVIGPFLILFLTTQWVERSHAAQAPLRVHPNSVQNEYLVTYEPQSEMSMPIGPASGTVKKRIEFNHSLWVVLDPAQLAQVRSDPNVRSIESNAIVTLAAVSSWGQDRIDQQNLPLSGGFVGFGDGAGVHAYIVDTGILSTHQEFIGRIGVGTDTVNDGQPEGTDCQGHGTHVAGTVGGTSVGVAPKATLHSVRVMDCSGKGSVGSLFAGLDWIVKNAVKPAVVNMSLTSASSDLFTSSVDELVKAGITVVVAAGGSVLNFV